MTQEIKLESLDEGPGILPFKLGPSKIISHYHSFIQPVNLQELKSNINSINIQLDNIDPEFNNKTRSLFEPHLNYLKNKVVSISMQLQSFEIIRTKRGLIDGLGSVVKSITGNLDYTDAIHYNNAIKALQDSDRTLETEINNQVSLSKEWSSRYTKVIDSIVSNQNNIQKLLNKISDSVATNDYDLIKYAHLAQVFLILSDNVDSISHEISNLQNMLAFIKTGTLHHSVLNNNSLYIIINKLRELYGNDKIIDLDSREYFDIIRIGSYYLGNDIIIVFKFPVVLPHIYDMYKLSIIPNKNNQILSPPFPFLAIYEREFRYMAAECPRTSKWYICNENRSLQTRATQDCFHQLITNQQQTNSCHPSTVTLENPAFEKLDEIHYTISFPSPTRVHLSCGQDLHKVLKGSYVAIVPRNCFVETAAFTISNVHNHLKGQILKIMDLPLKDTSQMIPATAFKLDSINLDQLHDISKKILIQQPLKLNTDSNDSLYHTTIPLYVVLFSASALGVFLLYRKKCATKVQITPDETKKDQIHQSTFYAEIPIDRRINPDQLPAQFTTKVSHIR